MVAIPERIAFEFFTPSSLVFEKSVDDIHYIHSFT